MPSDRFLALPVKKLTVMGIIGNTQGVMSAASPAKKASTINPTRDSESAASVRGIASCSGVPGPCVESVVSTEKFAANAGGVDVEVSVFWSGVASKGTIAAALAVNLTSMSCS